MPLYSTLPFTSKNIPMYYNTEKLTKGSTEKNYIFGKHVKKRRSNPLTH